MNYPSFNRVEIDPEALAYNFRFIRERVGDQARVMAMVKSDAYGHGLDCAAQAFSRAGCTDFGVAEIGEGVALRESGCSGTIHILMGFQPEQVDFLFSHQLIPLLYSEKDLRFLNEHASSRREQMPVYLKFDCGMGRLGFDPAEASRVRTLVQQLDNLRLEGIMSHYPCSDDRSSTCSTDVFSVFSEVNGQFMDYPGLTRSICNSGGALYFPDSWGEMVRAGIALYGYYPDGKSGREAETGEGLRPAMKFVTRVIQLKSVKAGSGISYGHTYVADRDMRVAVLPVGYSNGYFRTMSNRAEVLIRGQRAPLLGRICMNLSMVDVSGIDMVEQGDEVVLLGNQDGRTISGDEIAQWSGTISYEVLCSIGNSNQRFTLHTL